MKLRIIYLLGLLVLGISSCTTDANSPGIEYMPDMYQSPAVEYYNESHTLPPEQVIPIEISENDLISGEELYNTFCVVCHGINGEGDGTVPATGKYPSPPAYNNLQAGYIYNVITQGKNAMSSYAYQLTPNERWLVVAYIQDIQA
jgi:mono/diheme cytochrome c family protein